MIKGFGRRMGMLAALIGAVTLPVSAQGGELESVFDTAFGTSLPAPQVSSDPLFRRISAIASAESGRIGVAAMDLATGRSVGVMDNQPFPLASTSKIAIVATFLDGVDRGVYRLDDLYPLMVPLPSRKFQGPFAPVRPGARLSAHGLIEAAITRSDNQATDALLAIVGGPQAVNRWLGKAGITGMRLDRDIATLVRDDGVIDPATTVDTRDSATPEAMVQLLSGLHQGRWLSRYSTGVLLGAMERCKTSKHRIRALLPEGTLVRDKTGTLFNTASDVGYIYTPDGRALAVAIYVTGQGGKPHRNGKIASIARALYDGYVTDRYAAPRTAARR